MRSSRIILAAVAVLSLASLTVQAEARKTGTHFSAVTQFCGDRPCPTGQSEPVRASRTARALIRASNRGVAAVRPAATPSSGREALPGPSLGLVTVSTAAGIDIKCSPEFAASAAALIADAVAHGIKFTRITCYSTARSHKHHHGICTSNHCGGDAFDSRPAIPARLVRAHGLRSGCDFSDCRHVDNAKNVGGMAFWNKVRHHRPVRLARSAKVATIEFAPRSRHDNCSRAGDAAGIGCQLRRWVRCPVGAVKVTQHPYRKGSHYCAWDKSGECMIAAHWTLSKGTRLLVSNPANAGEQLYVTIGDKGPHPATTAKLDFSPFAARALGYGRGSGCAVIH